MSVQPSVPVNLPILLGTSNTAKQDALRWLVEDLALSPTTPAQMGLEAIPEEAGYTHQAIAQTKAMEWSRVASMLVIASDGGLVLPILGSRWESRHTHRFAGPEADNALRLKRLLDLMRPYSDDQREASWVEALAIADQGRLLASWERKGATGIISDSSIGIPPDAGFWAFSVWYFPQFGKTYDQLSLEEREQLGDHWVKLRQMVRAFFHEYLEPAK